MVRTWSLSSPAAPRFFELLVQAVKAVSKAFDAKQDRPFVARVCVVFTRLALLSEPGQLGDELLLNRLSRIRGYIAALPPQGVESVEPVLAQRLCTLDDEAQSRLLREWGDWHAWGPVTALETAVDKARANEMSLPSALRAAFPTMMDIDRHD